MSCGGEKTHGTKGDTMSDKRDKPSPSGGLYRNIRIPVKILDAFILAAGAILAAVFICLILSA